MDEKILTHINVNGEQFQIGGGNGIDLSNYHTKEEEAFTKTESNGAQMSGCTASGQYAVAEGQETTASGKYSHAEGNGTKAYGNYSHAEGLGTSATTNSEHASGRYNVSLSGSSSFGDSGNTLFTVGNGYITGYSYHSRRTTDNAKWRHLHLRHIRCR